MNIRTGILITFLAMGCGGEEEAASGELENAAEQIQAAAAAAGEAVEAAAAEGTEAAAEGTEAAAEGTEAAAEGTEAAAEGPQNMAEGLAALGEAMAAAQAASENAEGDTHCEQAYNGALAMIAALSNQGGDSAGPSLPSEETFLGGCNDLPEAAQQCMVMSYAMANQETCSALAQTPEVLAFRNLMRPE